jgi:hypothetical protein
MTIVDDFNRTEIQRKYIDHLIGKMDFMEIKRELWNYINRDKNRYSNYSLELEISRDAPIILGDIVTGVLHLDQDGEKPPIVSSGKKSVKTTPRMVGV